MLRTMVSEDRSKKRRPHVETKNPTVEQAVAAIQALDGDRHTMVTIVSDANGTLTIGGGNDGLCVVDLSLPSDRYLTLQGDVQQQGEVDLVTGGQLAPFSRRFVVELSTAVEILQGWSGKEIEPPAGFEWVDSSEVD